jgi:hypothetical protein
VVRGRPWLSPPVRDLVLVTNLLVLVAVSSYESSRIAAPPTGSPEWLGKGNVPMKVAAAMTMIVMIHSLRTLIRHWLCELRILAGVQVVFVVTPFGIAAIDRTHRVAGSPAVDEPFSDSSTNYADYPVPASPGVISRRAQCRTTELLRRQAGGVSAPWPQ